jgi:nucleoside recognition membrane protein YjiH
MARHTANLPQLLCSLCHIGVWRVVLENGCIFGTRFSAKTYTFGLLEMVGLLGSFCSIGGVCG